MKEKIVRNCQNNLKFMEDFATNKIWKSLTYKSSDAHCQQKSRMSKCTEIKCFSAVYNVKVWRKSWGL